MITLKNIWARDSDAAQFIRAYIECALWSSINENDDPFDSNYDLDDIAPATLADIISDCESFIKLYSGAFAGNFEQAGHDLWLTRNGHGAGFWDRPEIYGKSHAEQLTSACGWRTSFPVLSLYAQDGKIHIERA